MCQNASDLYHDLIEKHKDDPQAIMEEYSEKYKDQLGLFQYTSIILGFLALLTFGFGLYLISWVWETIEAMVFSIPLMLTLMLIATIIAGRLIKLSELSTHKWSEFSSIRRTYEKAYIDILYPNQFDRINKTEGDYDQNGF